MKDDGLSNDEVAEIFRRYGHLILRRCKAMVRDQSVAEDVLQEVFVKIIRHGTTYRDADSKLGWLYRVADNCCFDAWNRHKARPHLVAFEEGHGDQRPPAVRGVTLEESLTVARALERLTERSRRVAVLAYVDGLTQNEIASEIGWSRQTINRKLREIRDRLGRWLHVN